MRVPVLLVVAAVFTSALASGCHAETPGVRPTRLRLGVAIPPSFDALPDRVTEAQLAARFAPLATYLETAIRLPVTVDVTRNVNRLTEQFESGDYDLAFLGAAHFAHAHARVAAVPLVMREEDRRTTSVFVAAAGDPRAALTDFRGARFAFGPALSSSHLMARNYLEHLGIAPDSFFGTITHSDGPGDTALLVQNGTVDLGVGTTVAITRMFASGTLSHDRVRILLETPPYVNLLWAATGTLPLALRDELRDAFLALSLETPAQQPILSSLEATAFMPASIEDYEELSALMRRLSIFDRPLETNRTPR